MRNPSGEISERQKQQKVAQLVLAGATYEQAAQEAGYAERGAAWKAVHRLLSRVECETADGLRDVEGARLDRLWMTHWPKALAGDHKSALLCLRISERRARLFGLDAPVKVDATVRSETDAAIAELAAELGLAAGGSPIPGE